MKKYNRVIIISILSMLIIFIIGYMAIYKKSNLQNEVNIEAKTDSFKDLYDLEDKSPIIVKGKKISEGTPNFDLGSDGSVITGYMISDFQIIKVIKNSTDKVLDIDDNIPIFENEAYHKETNTIYHVGGYEKMKEGNEYILFLRPSFTHENYIPMGVVYGKVPLSEEESHIATKFSIVNVSDDVLKIIKDAKEKYKNY